MSTRPGAVAVRGRLVVPDAVIDDGLIVIEADRILWVGGADQAASAGFVDVTRTAVRAAEGSFLLPGLVDLHNHGGGGASFPDAQDLADVRRAAVEHLKHGTTSLVASLVTADPATLVAQASLLAEAVDTGDLVGIHLEGPFLSNVRRGAHDPTMLQAGDSGLVQTLASAARGHIVTMTVAPEVVGVRGPTGAIEALAATGAVPSFGHTDADVAEVEGAVAEARQALTAAGTRSARPTATHLFNGMRPLHHRAPGPVAACLESAARGELVVELIADGVHLDDALVRMVFGLLDPGAIVLVTDAMAGAGMPDGSYQLGTMNVRVLDGVARTEDGAIAGGTAHLLDVVRSAVRAGVPLENAVRSASLTPAGVLGRKDIGALQIGRRADLLVTDAHLEPLAVMRSGRWLVGATTHPPR